MKIFSICHRCQCAPWAANISANFWKNLKRSSWECITYYREGFFSFLIPVAQQRVPWWPRRCWPGFEPSTFGDRRAHLQLNYAWPKAWMVSVGRDGVEEVVADNKKEVLVNRKMRQETVSSLGPLDLISGIQRWEEYSKEEEKSKVVFENLLPKR